MKSYTMINMLTKQVTTVQATTRREAKQLAIQLATGTAVAQADNHIAYWLEQQAYHDATGYQRLV